MTATLVTKFKPQGDRVLIRRDDIRDPYSASGLITPDGSKEKPAEGVVLAVGDGKMLDNGLVIAIRVKVGDHVVFGKYAGSDVTIDNEELVILRDDEIMGTLVLEADIALDPSVPR